MEGAEEPGERRGVSRGQAARRVSISEESADQPGGSDHPETSRSLVVTEWAEGCKITVRALKSFLQCGSCRQNQVKNMPALTHRITVIFIRR